MFSKEAQNVPNEGARRSRLNNNEKDLSTSDELQSSTYYFRSSHRVFLHTTTKITKTRGISFIALIETTPIRDNGLECSETSC